MEWLAHTGQRWKVLLFLVVFLGAILSTFLPEQNAVSVVLACLVGLGALVGLAFTVRCPRCRRFPFWYLISEADAGSAWPRLIDAKVCPMCGE